MTDHATQTYKLPPAFYADHIFRQLDGGTLVRETKRYVVVELDADDYDEIMSDATYYRDEMGSDAVGYFDPHMMGLQRSAAATVAALERQGRPEQMPAVNGLAAFIAHAGREEATDDVPLVDVPTLGRKIRSYDRHATRRKAERELADLLLCEPLRARLVRTSDPEKPWAIEVADEDWERPNHETFTVKYGTDGSKFRYTHTIHVGGADALAAAQESADLWLAGNGFGGTKEGELRVWVEGDRGEVVYGQAARRAA